MISGGLRSIFGQAGTAVFGVVVYATLARLLSPQELGLLLSIMAVVFLAALASRLGLGPILTRAIARASSVGSVATTRSAVLQSVLAVMVAAFVLGLGTWMIVSNVLGYTAGPSISDTIVAGLLIAWIASLAMEGILADAFRGLGAIGHAAWVFRLAPLMMTSAAYALILMLDLSLGIPEAMAIAALSSVIVTAAGFALLMSKLGADRDARRGDQPVSFGHAFPVWISSLGGYVATNMGLWAIIVLGSAVEVAEYGLSSRIVAPILLPLIAVNGFITPIVATLFARNEQVNLERVLRSTSTISSVISIAGAALLVVLAPLLLRGLFGSFYEQAYPVVVILTIGSVANVISGSPGATLLMTGQQWLYAQIMVIGMVVGLALVFLGYRQFGVAGVAASTSLVTSGQFGAMAIGVRRRIGVWTVPYLRPSDAISSIRSLATVSAVTARWN